MYKNYGLCGLAAIIALLNATINCNDSGRDWFEGMRRPEDRAARTTGEPVLGVFTPVETESGREELRLRPVEGATATVGNILGGNRNRDTRRNVYYRD